MKPGMRDFSFVFAAGGEKELSINGDYFHVISAPTDIELEFGRGGRTLARSEGMGGTANYSYLKVISPVAQTVVLSLGFGVTRDGRATINGNVNATIQEGNTRTSTPDVSLLAAATNTILAADATRLTAIVENLSATVTLRVGGAGTAAAAGNTLAPGEKIVLDGTAAILGHNPDAGAVDVAVTAIQQV